MCVWTDPRASDTSSNMVIIFLIRKVQSFMYFYVMCTEYMKLIFNIKFVSISVSSYVMGLEKSWYLGCTSRVVK
jgi:hypothetical protein